LAENLIGALKAGSGIDIGTLARDLVEATRAPQKALIDQKLQASEARISGYGVVQFGLSEIRKAFDALKDAQSLATVSVRNPRSEAVSVTATGEARPGIYQVEVLSVLSSQRSLSNGFASRTTPLSNAPAQLSLTRAGTATTIELPDTSPAGIVTAINGSGTGLTAELVETGGALPLRIVVSGGEGASNAFTLSSSLDAGVLDFGTTAKTAADARIRIDGVEYQRSSNRMTGLVPGLTFDLQATTSSAGTVSVVRDTTELADRVRKLAAAYDDFAKSLDILTDRDSEVEEFGGALVGDPLVRQIRSQVEGFLRAGGAGGVATSAEFGLSTSGETTLDEVKLKRALENNPEGVLRFFTGDGNAVDGRSGRAVKALEAMTNPVTGLAAKQKLSAVARTATYQQQLGRLEERMDALLARYTRQFSIMESIVGNSNSLRTSLQGTFEGLAEVYKRR
jgi:flagellar hook-associated protein 2